MKKLAFAWDATKAKKNLKKHGVSFEEAKTVFFDEHAVQFWDEDHSSLEDRFLMLGMSGISRLLLVVHCYRDDDSIIRIISARAATEHEQTEYDGGVP
uniref:BrnT family toxin n=1 Tax=Candidatus Electronema sp. TaxID=2698783 RepID=UPI004055D897